MSLYDEPDRFNYNLDQKNYEPLDEYQRIVLEEFYSRESRKKIVAMAVREYKQRYGKIPKILKIQVNWAMANAFDHGGTWKQSQRPHNLRIIAKDRLVEQMVNTEYNVNLDWFAVQELLRDQEVPIVCGSHFIDKQYFTSPNIM